MPKFFVTKDKITEDRIIIDTSDAAHISRVLRLNEGGVITVCDGMGTDYEAVIEKTEASRIICAVRSKYPSGAEPNIEATLFQGLPKASKMEYIIQKTTELGISKIVPVKLARCVVKIDSEKDAKKKTDRWRKISEAAAKQSGRGIVPEIGDITTLDEVLKRRGEYDLFFVPYECEEQKTLREILLSKENVKKVGFIIGPEGGFDLNEAEKIRENGVATITLGKRILRTETAGEAVTAMTMYEIGDVNK